MPDKDRGLYQRNQMEDKAKSDGRLYDLSEDIALLAEQKKRVEQSHAVKNHRNSEPD